MSYSVEIIEDDTESALLDILSAYQVALPAKFQYPDAKDYFRSQLRNPHAIHVLLRKSEEPIGYILAIPHNEAIQDPELVAADPALQEDPDRLYVDTMEIAPHCLKTLIRGKLFLLMSKALLDEGRRKGYTKFSQHARVISGLSEAFQKLHGDTVTLVRRVENWPFYNYEEPTDYIEGTYDATRGAVESLLVRLRG